MAVSLWYEYSAGVRARGECGRDAESPVRKLLKVEKDGRSSIARDGVADVGGESGRYSSKRFSGSAHCRIASSYSLSAIHGCRGHVYTTFSSFFVRSASQRHLRDSNDAVPRKPSFLSN